MKIDLLQAVIFDFDGTLTIPGLLDFPAIKSELGCPEEMSLLEYLASIPDPVRRKRAEEVLERYEFTAAAASTEHPGAGALLHFIRSRGLRTAIITRNTRGSVLRAFENCRDIGIGDFELIVTRDDPFEVKPSPAGILHIADTIGIAPGRMLMVGDYIYDIEAGRRAGTRTVFLDNLPSRPFPLPPADHYIRELPELREVLHRHLSPTGKEKSCYP